MFLRNFKHAAVESVKEVEALTKQHPGKAAIIAGGTDLLGALKDNIHPAYPDLLIDIKPIKALAFIAEDRKGLKIGALATLADISKSRIIKEKYPLIAEAAKSVAAPQIRNVATIGGNICQEPRCWYYRYPENTFHCFRKDGVRCDALLGDNRYHSVFGSVALGRPPCSAECPGNTDIPRYLDRIRSGDLQEAAKTVLLANPLAAITGRVCPHFCESGCNRGEFDEAVSIRAIERHIGDYILDHAAELMPRPKTSTKKKVAIVGSGPAGLSAAFFLAQAGHKVTVFDNMPKPGGMLTYCIPAYRLPKEVVERQVDAFKNMGIEFKQNVEVGAKGHALQKMRKEYDGIFLASGVWRQRKLGLPREELLLSGLDFLVDVAKGERKAPGKRVLVIGGGSVAVDVAITAKRLGAKEVIMACLETRSDMPAFPEDSAQALEEGVQLLPSWGPQRILEEKGHIIGVDFAACTSVFDDQGRFNPAFDMSLKKTVKADVVISAIGTGAELAYLGKAIKTERGLVVVDQQSGATNIKGVYAGGDMVSGAASVIEAISGGRKAAKAMNRDLFGQKEPRAKGAETEGSYQDRDAAAFAVSHRAIVPDIEPSTRTIDREDKPTLDLRSIQCEAGRCVNCGCIAVNASDLAPALMALNASIKTNKRTISADEFFSAAPFKTTVLDKDELVLEIGVPQVTQGSFQKYIKYRIRNSIDFPIVSLACVINGDKNQVNKASMVLGAVAPRPHRIWQAEDFLKGKSVNEESVEAAGAIATRGVMPLGRNKYKVQIIKALIRKALLNVQ